MANRSKTKQELLDEIATPEQRITALERVNTQKTPGSPDRSLGWGPFLNRVVVLGAAGSIVVALMGLLGYVPGLGLLGSVREGYIPMAPSTAISFIVLGGILLAMTLRSLSGASLVLFGALGALVSLFGALEVAGHFTGSNHNLEDALVPAAGYLGEIPIARMSPSTGALFFLAGLAALALLWRVQTQGRETRLGHWGGSLGSLVLGIGLLFCLAYLYGSPLLYGRGPTVPMALTTALAFLMLGAATVGVSGEDAIPVSLLAGARRAGQPMSARRRFLFLTLIMVGACAIVMVVMTVILYRHDIEEHSERLQVTVQSQARLMEAMARHDSVYEQNTPGGPREATLSQIVDAHEHYEGFGETGEFALARRDGDFIVFILRHRYGVVEHPPPVAFDSELAEPMRLALKGLSGTVIGLDYRGETVLAAHEPVAVLNLGIVMQIDLAEIRAPFIRSGLSAAAVALLVILAGTALFFRIGNPIIARLEAYSRDLEKEMEERKRAEEALRTQQAEQQIILNSVPAMIFYKDKENRFIRVNRALAEATGKTIEEMEGESLFQLYPDLAEDYWLDDMEVMSTGKPKRHIIEPLETPEGKMWVETDKIPYRDEDGKIIGIIGFALDITDRKRAEEARARLNAQLEAKNDELEQIIYAASHDLRSPLVNIDGYGKELELAIEELRSALGRDKQPTEALEAAAQLLAHDIPEALRFIRTSASKMDTLLTGLLKLSRFGRAALTIDSLDMNELMGNVVDACKFQVKDAEAELDIGDLPPCEGDAVLVNQVFSNLLGNALQYLDPERSGAIRISGRVDGDRSVYCVEDNGVGIAPAHRQSIFEIFYRLEPAKSEGEGLGLTIVQQILGRLSGKIWVESTPGEGSCFYVALPAVQKNR